MKPNASHKHFLFLQEAEQLKQAFQESYFKNGIKDFKSQQSHLKKLAGLYKRRFNLDRKWQDALKVP